MSWSYFAITPPNKLPQSCGLNMRHSLFVPLLPRSTPAGDSSSSSSILIPPSSYCAPYIIRKGKRKINFDHKKESRKRRLETEPHHPLPHSLKRKKLSPCLFIRPGEIYCIVVPFLLQLSAIKSLLPPSPPSVAAALNNKAIGCDGKRG